MATNAELLADLLDGRLDPAQAPAEIAELAELAGAVSQHITLVPPTPDFRAALREDLLQTVGASGGGSTGGGGGPVDGASGVAGSGSATSTAGGASGAAAAASGIPAVVAAVAATAVLAASTWTVTTDSVPGDPLYGLKQGIESLQLVIADDARDVELLAGFATERVREAVGLADAAVVSGLLVESERLLDDALVLAVTQGRQVQDLLDAYAAALVTLHSRTDDPGVRAQLDQLMADVGVTPSPSVPDPTAPTGPALAPDPQDGLDPSGDASDEDAGDPGDQPQDQPDDEPSDGPLDELDDPLDELDDPLDELDDPLDELDDLLDDLEGGLDETLREAPGTLGG